jgi:hypothetical protein
VHAFVLSRVEAALAEWSERERLPGATKDRSRGARSRPARKAASSRNASRERIG